ncbi:MAG TPA: ATPase, T2SS/T4P/T4SS family [Pirellulaceae bacterium]|jgi:type II secretory ATPase GspE/PulE/Tfp pilus assembly ATPase PilB-like protein|nr:ATPase, T2SS/T4P/T4SS family [Pirellulaceae bacterium]
MADKQEEIRPLHEMVPPVTLLAKGADDDQQDQGNLLAAKQSPAFLVAGGVISHCLTKRGSRLMLDCTQAAVGVKFDVDGVWMAVDPYDRQTGDAMFAVLKKITNLNVQDRKSRQDGKFGVTFKGVKFNCTLTSQGVKTGERVMITIAPKKPRFEKILDLGMREKVREQFKSLIDEDKGFILFSAAPGNGLSTLWTLGLETADRFVRDFVSLEEKNEPEDEIINVGVVFYDSQAGESPASILPRVLLKQPDVFIAPNLFDLASVSKLCEQVNREGKLTISRVPARDAAEALVRVVQQYPGAAAEFAKAVTVVLNSRLVRKLCEKCKQAYQPAPQLLQKLGIPAGRVQNLYKEFTPPPPEELVDEKGKPIEIETCRACGGIGYRNRTAIFEMLVVGDEVRQALAGGQASADVVRKAARAGGHRSMQEEGILLVAQGVTSLPELQRVLKQA